MTEVTTPTYRGVPNEMLLDIQGLSKSFGKVQANRDITIQVRRGEIVALLGENGAGKSTLVNEIFGTRSRAASAWSTSTSSWCRS